eukprot:767441-Hanusia_phi.AAC.3
MAVSEALEGVRGGEAVEAFVHSIDHPRVVAGPPPQQLGDKRAGAARHAHVRLPANLNGENFDVAPLPLVDELIAVGIQQAHESAPQLLAVVEGTGSRELESRESAVTVGVEEGDEDVGRRDQHHPVRPERLLRVQHAVPVGIEGVKDDSAIYEVAKTAPLLPANVSATKHLEINRTCLDRLPSLLMSNRFSRSYCAALAFDRPNLCSKAMTSSLLSVKSPLLSRMLNKTSE